MFVIKVLGVVRRKPILGMGCLFAAIATSLSCGGSSPAAQVVPPVNKTVTALAISPTNVTIPVRGTQQFTATASYSDGSTGIVTTSATWSSSNSSVASIQKTGTTAGLVTGVAGGPADIMASLGNITSDTTLTVSGGTATGLALSVINPSIAPQAKLQIVAVMEYSDGSNQKVTTSASWNSSNPAVATVESSSDSNPGVVTGVGLGTTTISASVTGFPPAQTNLTVANNAVLIPLMDMTTQNYLGFEGGLYENTCSTPPCDAPPPDHDAAGTAAAAAITPLDQNGNSSSKGAIVFLGIGMSNATLEFSAFVNATASSQNVNHSTLAVLDGAYGSVTACPWTVENGDTTATCPEYTGGVPSKNQYDRVRDTVLATATSAPSAPSGCGAPPAAPCLTEKQVQVLWIKNANPSPALHGLASLFPFTDNCAGEIGAVAVPVEACNYEWQLGETIRAAKARYPNLQQIFISTRIYAGYASVPLNPEPYAYEYGFSAKWLIQAQIDQIRNQTVDPVAGDLNYTNGTAAWTAWGPYLWAYGTTPRSDQLIWCNGQSGSPCNGENDFQSDGTHPNTASGVPKVVNLMMKFFSTSPYTPVWFCASKSSC